MVGAGRQRTIKRLEPLLHLGSPAFLGLLWMFDWWSGGGSNSRPLHCERGGTVLYGML